jgi:REP element-mobilizing transposase RayT
MSQSLVQLYLHIVFSTKNRVAYLADEKLLIVIHKYLHGICDKQECPAIKVGGVADHVHILCRLGKTGSVTTLVGHLKRDSSKHAKTISPRLKQAGYGAFSISPGHVDALVEYIANQADHHRKVSFQDEFRPLLRKYRIE